MNIRDKLTCDKSHNRDKHNETELLSTFPLYMEDGLFNVQITVYSMFGDIKPNMLYT